MLTQGGKLKFAMNATGTGRYVFRLPDAQNMVLRWAFLRAIAADTHTVSLYLYDDTPIIGTTPLGTVSGVEVAQGAFTTGVDPATVPADFLVYSKTGVAIAAGSAVNSSISEAPGTAQMTVGRRFAMIDVTVGAAAWSVTGFFRFSPT